MAVEESRYDAADKLDWEVRKLQSECRPWYRGPAGWLSVATIAGALTSTGVQWQRSDREYQLAQIKADSAKLEAARAQFDRDLAKKLVDDYNGQVLALRKDLDGLEAKRKELGDEIDKFQKQVAALATPNRALNADDVRKLHEGVQSIQAQHTALNAQYNQSARQLKVLRPQQQQSARVGED
jgi:chromosome segregation ATPase